jgi:hypothetical protein
MSRIWRIAPRSLALAVLSGGCLLCFGPTARGQDVTELSLKAAFIHNFVKFTEWPRDVLPPAAPLVACVLGDAAFGDVLENYVKRHPVEGHQIVVSRIAADGLLRSCHLLYLAHVTTRQAAQVAARLDGAPVLTLSDVDQFVQGSGMAQFYVEEGKIRFRINLNNARRSRLQLSSKLLSLATLVKTDPNVIPR